MTELTWIKHDGGPMPVPGDTVVQIRQDDGWESTPQFAEYWMWYGRGDKRDVTEYAIVTPSPSATIAASAPGDKLAIDAHYTKWAIEPIEYSMANGLDAMQHSIVKYTTRFRDKHGKRDLIAARHVLDMLIAREYPND